jgi:hypothetical protein
MPPHRLQYLKTLEREQTEEERHVNTVEKDQSDDGERSITIGTVMRLAHYFGTSAAVWLRLKVFHDLEAVESELCGEINEEVRMPSTPLDFSFPFMLHSFYLCMGHGGALAPPRPNQGYSNT